jgi:hypothetical protein
MPLSNYLLEPTSERSITDEIHGLDDLISQHVYNFYPIRPTIGPDTLSDDLLDIEYTGSADIIAAACLEESHREAGLRHFISHILLRSIDPRSDESISMLPSPVATLLPSMRIGRESAGKDRLLIVPHESLILLVLLTNR